jgi:large subunit ribosomal protein L25
MQAIPLNAEERDLLGKKVKKLRRQGLVPAHVYGNKVETEHVTVKGFDFM